MSDEALVAGAAPLGLQKWINGGQLFLSLITAAGAFYISVQQHRLADDQARLALQVETQAKTSRYAEELTKYMDKMTRAGEKESPRLNALMIDLVDAMTSAASSTKGEIENDRLIHMPMWLALSTGNADGLRLIAADAKRREIWLPMALQSTDKNVRETAIEVLRTSRDQQPVGLLMLIFELSDELDNPELEEKALSAMQHVIARMKRRGDPALEPGDRALQPIVIRIGSIRTFLRSSMAAPDLSLVEREQLQRRERGFTATLDAFGVQGAVAVTMPSGVQVPVPSASPSSNAPQLADNRQALQALESGDAEVRRKARVDLSNQLDAATMASLLENIRNPGASYRAKLGAVVALRETPLNVALPHREVRSVVTLIGDDDATLRTNAAELLMKITDPSTVRTTYDELVGIVAKRDDAGARPNQVYNAVAILGTWARVLPDSLADQRAKIERFLTEARTGMSIPGSQWRKTAALIDDLMALKAKQQVET